MWVVFARKVHFQSFFVEESKNDENGLKNLEFCVDVFAKVVGRPFTDIGRAQEWYKTWTKRLSVNSRVNLFSDAGSWQIEDRHTSFSKSVITFATSTRAISECADLPLRKTFSCHKFKPIPERCEWFSHARCFFRAFLSRSQKTTKMDWKTWNFVSMYLRRS